MADREFKLVVKTQADTTGLAQIRTMLEQQAKAGGYSAQAVEKIGAAFDKLTASAARYEADTRNGLMSEAEAASKLAEELEATVKELQNLGESERNASEDTEGFLEKLGEAAGSMKVGNERAIMLSQGIAGIVLSAANGTNAMGLYQQALTNVAMIMTTMGPGGVVAGAILMALGQIGIAFSKSADEAEEAAKKEVEAVGQVIAKLNEAHAAQTKWDTGIKNTAASLTDHIADLQRLGQELDANRKRQLEAANDEDGLAKFQDEQAVRAGTMSQDEADARHSERMDIKQHRERMAELSSMNEQQAIAEAKARAALEEAQAITQANQERDARIKAARELEVVQGRESKGSGDPGMVGLTKQSEGRLLELQKELDSIRGIRATIGDFLNRMTGGPGALFGLHDGAFGPIEDLRKEEEEKLLQRYQAEQARLMDAKDRAAEIKKRFPGLKSSQQERADKEASDRLFDERMPELGRQYEDAQSAIRGVQADRERFRDHSQIEDTQRDLQRSEQSDAKYALTQAKEDKDRGDQEIVELGTKLAESFKGTNEALASQISAATDAIKDGSTPAEIEKLKSIIVSNSQAVNQAISNAGRSIEGITAALQALANSQQNLHSKIADIQAQVDASR